jgi:cysteine desulfurase/selenocysteine lyase
MASARIYLDNAATTWPKPDSVYKAVERYFRELGAPAGRSAYAEANQVSQAVAAARASVARLLGAADPRRIVFALNGTDALNMAIHGVVRPGDHVVTTVAEHNSVLRPLRDLESRAGVVVDRVRCDGEGFVDPAEVARAVRDNTRLVVVTHASNVTGAIQPVAEIAKTVRERGALVLVDAAQTLGEVPFRVDDLGCDLLAAPGHKGLLGPLGTGVLYVAPGVEQHVASVRQGGTGTESDQDRQPDNLPYKLEVGSLNVPGVLGLGAAADFLCIKGLDRVRQHHADLTERLVAGLADIGGVKWFGPRSVERRVGVVSIALDSYDPQEAAAMLDAAYRVQVRSGLHCAPLMHEALGTLAGGGTVRFSVGLFNTPQEIDAAVAAVGEIAAEHQ